MHAPGKHASGWPASKPGSEPPPHEPPRRRRLFPGLEGARLDRHEIAGSLGDLGTFLPLLIAMSAQNGLDFASGLFFAGLFNLATGLVFAIPMAVQPMKAIAAVAITEGLTVTQIVAAGAAVSASVLLLGATGLIDVVNRWVPKSAVRGIQLAVGLAFLIKGVDMVAGTKAWLALDGRFSAALAAVVVLVLARSRVVPSALVLVTAGFVVAVVGHPSVLSSLSGGLWLPHPRALDGGSVGTGVLRAALPQIPLTTLNSVVAVCALSVDLFPDRPAQPRPVSISVGLMNLIGAPFGAMPMCHGAGGLAGQYRFGARTSGSILFLGAMKMALAVVFGSSTKGLCQAFPSGILGVMLAFSGVELALVARDQTRRSDALVALITAGVSLALNNVAIGFVVGLLVGLALRYGAADAEGDP